MELSAGSRFGPYLILDELGQGGMATVYRAEEEQLGRQVALKILSTESLRDKTFEERFTREARVIARLEHPHIVPLYAFGIEDRTPWMAMRLISGGSLQSLMEGGRLSPERTVRILRDVAEALDYAHRRDVVHRDVKPANILLDEEGRAYLADFGVARWMEGSTSLTKTGQLVGTPQYMSPEQARGADLGKPIDVYSLGIVAYEMLTGRTPFSGTTPVAVLMMHVLDPPPRPSDEEVPPPVSDVLMKCLAKDAADRWPTAERFVEALGRGLAKQEPGYVDPYETADVKTEEPKPGPAIDQEKTIVDTPVAEDKAPAAEPEPAAPAPPPPAPAPPPRPPVVADAGGGRRPLTGLWIGVGIVAVAAVAMALWLWRARSSHPDLVPTEASVTLATPAAKPTVVPPTPQTPTPAPMPTGPTPPPGGEAGDVWLNTNDGLEYVFVPPGVSRQGCVEADTRCYADEKPARDVTLSKGAWFGRTEVTVAAYQRFSDAKGWEMPDAPGFNEGWAEDTQPMVKVNWSSAGDYCAYAGGRLPTEAEWEHAARGGRAGEVYPWGDTEPVCGVAEPNAARFNDGEACPGDAPQVVASYSPNGYALYDVAGNVWEWCADWYAKDAYRLSAAIDPTGPREGKRRVLRGGSTNSNTRGLRLSLRNHMPPESRSVYVGFRCVVDAAAD